ncbi:MAG TPA: hypothetical protein DC053_18500 [Lachnoclostridium sp.]|nr:hypothetical protein [Lachnoclostridium sp.]
MAYNYYNIPFISINTMTNEKTKEKHQPRLSEQLGADNVALLTPFRKGHFQINGIEHYHPAFLVSEDAKENLIYPQGFLIMDARKGYFTDRSYLDSFELRYTLEGEGFLEYNGRKYTLRPGEGYWIDCKKWHYYGTTDTKWTSTIFHINGSLTQCIYNQFASNNYVKFSRQNCPNFEMLQMQVLKAASKHIPFGEYQISCYLNILLTELLTSQTNESHAATKTDTIANIIAYVRDNYTDDITIEHLMHQFGISRTLLCKNFKTYTGFSIKQYIITLRINHAKFLLTNTDYSVEQISELVGFHNTTHFIKHFQSKIGLTPLQFKKTIITIRNTIT